MAVWQIKTVSALRLKVNIKSSHVGNGLNFIFLVTKLRIIYPVNRPGHFLLEKALILLEIIPFRYRKFEVYNDSKLNSFS